MGSHSVTCHPTQVSIPCLTSAIQADTRFTYPGGMEGWVDLVDLIAHMFIQHQEQIFGPKYNPSLLVRVELSHPVYVQLHWLMKYFTFFATAYNWCLLVSPSTEWPLTVSSCYVQDKVNCGTSTVHCSRHWVGKCGTVYAVSLLLPCFEYYHTEIEV